MLLLMLCCAMTRLASSAHSKANTDAPHPVTVCGLMLSLLPLGQRLPVNLLPCQHWLWAAPCDQSSYRTA